MEKEGGFRVMEVMVVIGMIGILRGIGIGGYEK